MRKEPKIPPPSAIVPRKLDIIEQKRKYELITPLYGGGVSATQHDPVTIVRATEIRGQLRFWWRAMRGGRSAGEPSLKKREDAIWGKAYEKDDIGIPNTDIVQIIVDPDMSKQGEAVKPFSLVGKTPKATKYVSGYAAFPLQLEPADVRKGVNFTLTIIYPSSQSLEIEAALWAWETFGGLGARTRRGFGALRLLETYEVPSPPFPTEGEALEHYKKKAKPGPLFPTTSEAPEQHIKREARKYIKAGSFQPGVPHLSQDLQVVATCFHSDPVEAWKNLMNKLQGFRLKKGENSKRSAWPEADNIRAMAGNGLTPDIKKFPRAAFGLPLIFHFGKNAPGGNYTLNEANIHSKDGKNKERFASPLILRPLRCSDNMAAGLAVLLEGSRVDLKHLVVQGDNNKPRSVEGMLTPTDTSKLTKKIPEMNNETDVLQAFMTFLKRG